MWRLVFGSKGKHNKTKRRSKRKTRKNTVFTMWRLVFGFKGKHNKTRRRSKRKTRKNNHETKKRKEKYVFEGG